MNAFKGPLGSHRNYLSHVALENFKDYETLKRNHESQGRVGTADKYKEFRFFLNAIESFNNILDYAYFEHEDRIKQQHGNVTTFRKAVNTKYPELEKLSHLANAYKHCVRTKKDGKKNTARPWARDLQTPQLVIDMTRSKPKPVVEIQYNFPWPLAEHEEILNKAFRFWFEYHNNLGPSEGL